MDPFQRTKESLRAKWDLVEFDAERVLVKSNQNLVQRNSMGARVAKRVRTGTRLDRVGRRNPSRSKAIVQTVAPKPQKPIHRMVQFDGQMQ